MLALSRHRFRRIADRFRWSRRGNAPPYPGIQWKPLHPFPAPGTTGGLNDGVGTYLNRSHDLGWPPRWDEDVGSRHWQYQLHGFDYVWNLDIATGRELILDWISNYPPSSRRAGWDPYCTSVRLINWCLYLFAPPVDTENVTSEQRERIWRSIHQQSEKLGDRLENHLLGNHLLENAAALAVCGTCFRGEDAKRWRKMGIELLQRELPEQVPRDGFHFERSAMYHQRACYLLVTLMNTGTSALRHLVEKPLRRMIPALAAACHPDGGIALLNDSALDMYPEPDRLPAFGRRLLDRGGPAMDQTGNFSLPDAGYYGARTGDGHYVICDAGEIGPPYQPGHAHGDLFSFELSLGHQRVIVDTGVFDYEQSESRAYCRSTRAHNTVEIEQRDQCDFWGVFRVGRRAHPHDVRWEPGEHGFRLQGRHDGYRYLPGRPVHHRRFAWHDAGILMVKDDVQSANPVVAESRLHLHPSCELLDRSQDACRIRYPGGQCSIQFAGTGALDVESTWYYPTFGSRHRNKTLVFRRRGKSQSTGYCIAVGPRPVEFNLDSGAVIDGTSYEW
jgi:uncharacterized heparinase superfamily protein